MHNFTKSNSLLFCQTQWKVTGFSSYCEETWSSRCSNYKNTQTPTLCGTPGSLTVCHWTGERIWMTCGDHVNIECGDGTQMPTPGMMQHQCYSPSHKCHPKRESYWHLHSTEWTVTRSKPSNNEAASTQGWTGSLIRKAVFLFGYALNEKNRSRPHSC